jgi:hypothetical protein
MADSEERPKSIIKEGEEEGPVEQLKGLFKAPKLPGWVWFLLGLIPKIPDWVGEADYWDKLAVRFGGLMSILIGVVGSPLFEGSMMVLGVGYLVFVGEPKRTIRSVWWTRIGWVVAGVVFLLVFAAFVAAYTASILRLPRHLTATETAEITSGIKPIVPSFQYALTVNATQDFESITYCLEIEKALIAGGLLLDLQDNITLLPRPLTGNPPGVFIQVKDANHPPSVAVRFRNVLRKAGIPTFYATNFSYGQNSLSLGVGYNADVKLPE